MAENKTAREQAFEGFRRSAGFQFNFVMYSGLEVAKAIDHICSSAEKLVAALNEWQPIGTAPKDGSDFLVGEVGGDRVDRAFFMDGELLIIGGNWTPTHWRHLPARPQQ